MHLRDLKKQIRLFTYHHNSVDISDCATQFVRNPESFQFMAQHGSCTIAPLILYLDTVTPFHVCVDGILIVPSRTQITLSPSSATQNTTFTQEKRTNANLNKFFSKSVNRPRWIIFFFYWYICARALNDGPARFNCSPDDKKGHRAQRSHHKLVITWSVTS